MNPQTINARHRMRTDKRSARVRKFWNVLIVTSSTIYKQHSTDKNFEVKIKNKIQTIKTILGVPKKSKLLFDKDFLSDKTEFIKILCTVPFGYYLKDHLQIM